MAESTATFPNSPKDFCFLYKGEERQLILCSGPPSSSQALHLPLAPTHLGHISKEMVTCSQRGEGVYPPRQAKGICKATHAAPHPPNGTHQASTHSPVGTHPAPEQRCARRVRYAGHALPAGTQLCRQSCSETITHLLLS